MNIRVIEAINEQINSELSASYSYLAMSAWCERQKFTGAARWLRLQSQEEYMHAMKLFDFILARDEQVVLKPLDQPRQTFGSLLEVFERALLQEQDVSRQIDSLYETAFHEKAFAAVAELQWFLTEQVEEEKTGREIVGKLRIVVVRRRDRNVAPVIAEIEHQHVESGEELPPVRIVGVGRETVAVGDEEPYPVRIAVPAHQDAGAVAERHLEGLGRDGNFKRHRQAPTNYISAKARFRNPNIPPVVSP